MFGMFYNCTSLSQLIIKFNTTIVNHMTKMFGYCPSLKSLDISTFKIDKCNEFNAIFEQDVGLQLYITENTYKKLKYYIPEYVTYQFVTPAK